MAHSHAHEDSDSYYPEQLCLIAFSGLFGGICLTLYFWQTSMLDLLLFKSFHPFVLMSGIALIGLTLIRAMVLWKMAGEVKNPEHAHHNCGHDHSHDCGHDHGHEHEHDCGHDHEHEHEHEHGAECGQHHHHEHDCGHEHSHTASHAHAGHDHDHEHGWAPWRYMVLLVPIILYLLGLPNKGLQVEAGSFKVSGLSPKEKAAYVGLIAAGPSAFNQLVSLAGVSADPTAGPVNKVDFETLRQAAFVDPDSWEGKVVRVIGQFRPSVQSQREFSLMRLRIKCCAADAVPLDVPIICREPVMGIQPMQWIEVTGIVEFQKRDGTSDALMTVLRVPSRKSIQRAEPDANPYIE